MGKVYITGYSGVAKLERHESLEVLSTPPTYRGVIEIDDEPQLSEPFDEATNIVMFKVVGEDCCIAWGENPEPDPELDLWQDGERHQFQAVTGHRLAVIAAKVVT